MRRIVWADEAIEDLARIRAYVGQFNPTAARHLAGALKGATDSLAQLAERGRAAKGGRRELVAVWPYIIKYRIDGQTVYILRVRHGARQPE